MGYRHDQLALTVITVGLPLVLVVPISENSDFLLHLKPVGCVKLALRTPTCRNCTYDMCTELPICLLIAYN